MQLERCPEQKPEGHFKVVLEMHSWGEAFVVEITFVK